MTEILNTIKEMQQNPLARGILNVVAALLIFVIGRLVAQVLRSFLKRLMTSRKVENTLISFVSSLSYILMMTFVVIAALGQLGIQTTSFIAILGAAGLAIGLALQGSLANFAAGVLMTIFKPFKTGDYIEAGGSAGVVEEITIFTTLLKTPDNRAVIIPNAQVTGGSIVNVSAKDTRRVDMVASVGYGDDLQKAKRVLAGILADDSRILDDPAPTVAVAELADSSVDFVVRPWVKKEDYWDVKFDVTEKIKLRLDEEGISIPFPQQDVHLIKENQ